MSSLSGPYIKIDDLVGILTHGKRVSSRLGECDDHDDIVENILDDLISDFKKYQTDAIEHGSNCEGVITL